MTPQREAKQVQRAIRAIPVEAIAPVIAAWEREGSGLWCLVDGELTFVPAEGGDSITQWDDPPEHAQIVRWVLAHPERIHPTHEEALAFVRSLFWM